MGVGYKGLPAKRNTHGKQPRGVMDQLHDAYIDELLNFKGNPFAGAENWVDQVVAARDPLDKPFQESPSVGWSESNPDPEGCPSEYSGHDEAGASHAEGHAAGYYSPEELATCCAQYSSYEDSREGPEDGTPSKYSHRGISTRAGQRSCLFPSGFAAELPPTTAATTSADRIEMCIQLRNSCRQDENLAPPAVVKSRPTRAHAHAYAQTVPIGKIRRFSRAPHERQRGRWTI
ncbi:hypothetical protein DCS_04138 [Drechmeria coniospora]|uniref:Uncharacterized protein n=1 Tax=Drechmeria coniospora TaxID=98403 RepID=A0A151GJB9_DRECN|nr:hypothetical protein DCS_04138 [Drechmeria coniospora]KYK57131.1 hypothetical protein DCS_04138 [Drechmeria coniospora]